MKTIVGFLSRSHGYDVLTKLLREKKYTFLQIYTHKLNPLSQDSTRSIRNDYEKFEKTCNENQIPLISIDSKNSSFSEFPDCDYVIEISWRYIIPQSVVKKAKILSFGIHRGKLPEYAGAEPIKQALEKNENEILLSAHLLDPEIDAGKTLMSLSYPVNYDKKYTLENNIQRLRDEITPFFGKLALQVLNSRN